MHGPLLGSQSEEARFMDQPRILMCPPDFYGIEYEINPWMHVAVQVDHALAQAQWEALHRTYLDLGLEIELAEPVAGLPDMVFTANAAVVWDGRAVLSNFHHAERAGEEPHWPSASSADSMKPADSSSGVVWALPTTNAPASSTTKVSVIVPPASMASTRGRRG